MRLEAATISDIVLSNDYPFVRTVYFKDRKYKVVVASNKEFNVGDVVLFIPGDSRLPEWLLKYTNFWDYKNNCGLLGGKKNDIVCPFNYGGNSAYFSYGMFISVPSGIIVKPDGKEVNITDEDVDKKLGVSYLHHGIPYYFSGDFFYMDVSVNRSGVPEIEVNYTEFENENEVIYEEYVPGRKFYVVIDRNEAHHMALGPDHNIYITTDEFSNYMFLSRTKRNMSGNLFVKSILNTGLDKDITTYFNLYNKFHKLTLEFMLRSTAFGGNKKLLDPLRNMLTVTDVYINSVPFGRFLSVEERNYLARNLELKTPTELYAGEFNYETIVSLGEKAGLVVRSPDSKKRGVLYTKYDRLRRKHTLH